MTSPRSLDQTQILEDLRKGLHSAPGPSGSSLPHGHFRMEEGRLQGHQTEDGAEAGLG